MTVFLQKEDELKNLKNQYFSITGQHSQFPGGGFSQTSGGGHYSQFPQMPTTPWQFSTMQKIPEVPQAFPIPQPQGTSILRLKEIVEEEERKRKRKGKAKEEPKEVKRLPKDSDQMMIKGAEEEEEETNKLSDIIRSQCINNSFEQLSLSESDSDNLLINDSTSLEENSEDSENLRTHFMPLLAEGPSITEVTSETKEEVFNED